MSLNLDSLRKSIEALERAVACLDVVVDSDAIGEVVKAGVVQNIDKMPQSNFCEIIEKYVEMNIAHPFGEGNGRAMRIWLDLMLKKEIKHVIDWNMVDKEEYLSAIQRSVVKDVEIKVLLEKALTNKINDRNIFMKGIDVSYYYEGYSLFKTEDL